MSPPSERTGERIAKLLARAGIASRREVERMIAEGRVKIGEDVVTTPATVLTDLRGVTVDGKPVKAAEAARLFVFNKPPGLITAERDPAGRPTIYTALRNALPPGTPRMMPVGRLDFNTEGLLLLTNDGELKRALELPSSGIPRTYRARTFGAISQAQLEDLIEGIEIDGIRYGGIDANMERSAGRNQWIELTLTEGKNREVRRVLQHFGLEVSRLLRTSYGPFELLDLPRGGAAEVRRADVERFAASLKAPGGADLAMKPRYEAVFGGRPARSPRSEPAADNRRAKPSNNRPSRPDKPAAPKARAGLSDRPGPAPRTGKPGASPRPAKPGRPRRPSVPRGGPRK